MPTTPRRLAAKFAASGLLLSAVPASAALSTGGTLPPLDPCVTYTVTLQGCQNPANSCDVRAREAAKTNPDATCNTLIQNAADQQAASLPQRTVVVPVTKNVNDTTVQPDAYSKAVAYKADDPNTHSMGGLGGFYLGQVHRAQTYLPATGWYSDYLQSQRKQQRDAWHASGTVVDSCSEYVYEKYYDYSVFEDALVKLGTNYRAIYDTAYAPALWGIVPASAIGTRGIADPSQHAKDGTAINPPITFQSGLPKNQFFTVPLGTAGSGKVRILKGSEDKIASFPGGYIYIYLKDMQRNGLDLGGVVFNDASYTTTLTAGASYYDESWAWHKAMSQRNATVLDEEMYELERLQSDFTALLQKREELAATIASMLNHKPLPQPDVGPYYDGYWRDPVWNPDPIRVIEFAQLDLNVLEPVVIAQPQTATLSSASSTTPSTPQSAISTGPVISPLPVYSSVLESQVVTQACGGNQLICLFYKLEAMDGAIEAALGKAQQRGCLTFSSRGPAACDWSPKRFAQRMMKLYQGDRERAYQKCMDYTDNNFAALKNKAMVITGKVNYPATNYTTSTTKLDQYFVLRDKYLEALSAVAGNLYDPVTEQLRLKWESGDSYSLGDDTFGATASYNVSFTVNNLGEADCAVSPRAHGTFTATGRAFSKSVQLLNAGATVTDTRADIDVDVLDNSIHLVDVHKDLTLGEYNLVAGSKMKSATFVDVSTTFVIVVVPVTLGAKVGGTVGINYGLNAQHKVTTTSAGCNVNSIGIGGYLMPFASVDAELYAGVDLFIVEAGIKGKLQLVHAGIPLNAYAGLAYGTNGSDLLTLELASRADLKFTFLSGSIAAYVEVGIWPLEAEFEETLVSWDGIHYDINLFNKSVSVPLADLRELLPAPSPATLVTQRQAL
jgi:hypothetical protein